MNLSATSATDDTDTNLSVEGVCFMLGVSRSTLDRMRGEPSFPQPLIVGKRMLRFPRAAVLAWVAARSAPGRDMIVPGATATK